MKRELYNELLKWKASPRRKSLVLYGARQVGKTWLLKEFGKNEYKDTLYVNFDTDTEVNKYFAGSIDPRHIIAGLEDHFGKKVVQQDTLVVFDEVRKTNVQRIR